jgi:DNA invertase Pin-like site-specific DNA recombinase
MSEPGKITASHLSRTAVIYVRQSTLMQVERNTESTMRQYDLASRARQLGWPHEAVRVIDGDLGISGSVTGQRDGFEGMVAEIALGQVGIVVALEVSRLARDNAAWYRLLDLAGVCDTLVADADGVYHPALFNDRLVLGMKGIMSEALCRRRHKGSYADLVVMPMSDVPSAIRAGQRDPRFRESA